MAIRRIGPYLGAVCLFFALSADVFGQVGRDEEESPPSTNQGVREKTGREKRRASRRREKKADQPAAAVGGEERKENEGGESLSSPRQVRVEASSPRRSGTEPSSIASASSAVVSVRTSNLTYRLFLAPNSVCVVEFPWDDAVYSVHPGDTDYVLLEGLDGERRRDPADALVFRPGVGFDSKAKDAQTMYTIQFVSGFILTLLFEPTSDIAQNSNRVVLRYQVAQIREYRRSIGLSDNMVHQDSPSVLRADFELESDPDVETFSLPTPATAGRARGRGRRDAFRRLGGGRFDHLLGGDEEDGADLGRDFDPATGSMRRGGGGRLTQRATRQEPEEDPEELEEEVGGTALSGEHAGLLRELRDIIYEANSRAINPKNLAPGRDGLVVVLLGAYEDENFEGVVRYALALTNTSRKPIYVLSLSPDILITTTARKEKTVVNSERLPVLAYAATTRSRHIRPGQIVYVACAVNRPVLSSNQKLSISYAHADAADRPVEALSPRLGSRKGKKRDE